MSATDAKSVVSASERPKDVILYASTAVGGGTPKGKPFGALETPRRWVQELELVKLCPYAIE